MPYRASLTKCVRAACDRLKLGQCDLAIITRNKANKYYTLFHPSEFEARLINKPLQEDPIVLACTGGELAAIVGAIQLEIRLSGGAHEDSQTLEIGKQLRPYNPDIDG